MLEPLYIPKTSSSPEVILDKKNDEFVIRGDILPEDSFDFFKPIFEWFQDYSENPKEETVLELSFSIINTSSTRRIISLLKVLEEIVKKGKKLKVVFVHLPEDELMEYLAYELSKAYPEIEIITKKK